MSAAILSAGPRADSRAARVVAYGGLIIYPTDTVYGLGCDPLNPDAVERLFVAKGRGARAVPVLCASLAEAVELVKLSPGALELARRYWPGALTIVAPLTRRLPERLHQGTGKLGVRVPGSSGCVRLIKACGGTLVGTSANISGMPSSRTAGEARKQLGSSVDLIIDGGRLEGSESTVVEVTGDDIIILRKGAIGVYDREKRG
jgi:L-threonylcarbamoyladenylate synthase